MKTLFVVAALAATMFAQGPGGPPSGPPSGTGPGAPPTDQITAYLALTTAQVQQLQSIQAEGMKAVQAIHQQIGTQQQALHTALASGSATAAAVGTLLLQIQTLEQSIPTTMTGYQGQAAKVLTADQTTKLAALQAAANLHDTIGQAFALQLLAPPAPPTSGSGSGTGAAGIRARPHRMGPGPGMRPEGPGMPLPQ
jgi:Spy/CpxP family protein refolding chaperone